MTPRQKAAREYHDRIRDNRVEAREDRWDAEETHDPVRLAAIKKATEEANRLYHLSVRLECIRRARIRSGATCP